MVVEHWSADPRVFDSICGSWFYMKISHISIKTSKIIEEKKGYWAALFFNYMVVYYFKVIMISQVR